MAIVVSAQLFLWLLVSPFILHAMGAEADYRWSVALIFLATFFLVLRMRRRSSRDLTFSARPTRCVIFPLPVRFGLVVFTLIYIATVMSNDLMFRRMGHEHMAEVYSQLPIGELLILRIYEVVYFPMLFAMLFALRSSVSFSLRLVVVVWFIGMIFTGVLDSRAKLITPVLLYYIFFIHPASARPPVPAPFVTVVGMALLLAAASVFIGRLDNFDTALEFAMTEVLTRVDGLELISNVSAVHHIPIYGTLDPLMFTNFISMIPFLEISAQLKAVGLTSSKNYLLQVVLGTESFDINNSLVTDLFYFGGYAGVVIGAALYASAVAGFDNQVSARGLWRTRIHAALLFAFVLNCMRVEYDYFGIVVAVFRDFLIIGIFFMLLKVKSVPDSVRHGNKSQVCAT